MRQGAGLRRILPGSSIPKPINPYTWNDSKPQASPQALSALCTSSPCSPPGDGAASRIAAARGLGTFGQSDAESFDVLEGRGQ